MTQFIVKRASVWLDPEYLCVEVWARGSGDPLSLRLCPEDARALAADLSYAARLIEEHA